jgi:hypothetical protein
MANKNFVVHNGLEVGGVAIFAGNSDIVTTGNITATSSGSVATVAVTKYVMQLPPTLGAAAWYKLGTFTVNSGVGAGETLEIIITAGAGYAGESISKDFVTVRYQSGSSPNIESSFYSLGYVRSISEVKVQSVNGSGTGTSWDVFVYISADVGNGFAEVRTTTEAKFAWVNTSASDPGTAAANLIVAADKLVTASSNVVVKSGNLYVGGNIYQSGSQVATATGSGLITNTFNGGDSAGPFTLTNTPADKDQIEVWWNGIYQPKATYSLATNQLTLSEAIPTGTVLEVKILAGAGAQLLGTLQDIDYSSSPTNGQFLQYNSASGKWRPASSSSEASVTSTAIKFAVVFGGI